MNRHRQAMRTGALLATLPWFAVGAQSTEPMFIPFDDVPLVDAFEGIVVDSEGGGDS